MAKTPPARKMGVKSQRTEGAAHVHFGQNVYVWDTISRSDLSCEEVKSTWYTPDEYNRMRLLHEALSEAFQQAATEVRQYVRKVYAIDPEWGEMNRIQGCWDAVMNEQDDQWDQNCNDPLRIARLCRTVSEKSEIDARIRGTEVEKDLLETTGDGETMQQLPKLITGDIQQERFLHNNELVLST